MIYAIDPGKMPRRVIQDENDFTWKRPAYEIRFKFWKNYGSYRAVGSGPANMVNRSQMRELYLAYTGQVPPRKFDDLLAAFANAGFTVMEIDGNNYTNLVG